MVSVRHMPEVLITNDDGIGAPGLEALARAASSLGRLWVVAPEVERSASSRSVTLDRPLRLREHAVRRYSLDGTPADCVLVAVRSLMSEPPAVVISGVNSGFNVGEDVEYSGTVGAAFEAANQGVPVCIAASAPAGAAAGGIELAARIACRLVRVLQENQPPPRTVFNLNVPGANAGELRWCRQGNPLQRGGVVVGEDPRGKRYYWIAERPDE